MGIGMGLGMDGDPPLESGHVGGAARRGVGEEPRHGADFGVRDLAALGPPGGRGARNVSAPAGGERGVQRPRAERAWVPATGAPTERHLVLLSPRQ